MDVLVGAGRKEKRPRRDGRALKTELWWVFKGVSDGIADSDIPVHCLGGVGHEPNTAMCGWGDGQYFGIG